MLVVEIPHLCRNIGKVFGTAIGIELIDVIHDLLSRDAARVRLDVLIDGASHRPLDLKPGRNELATTAARYWFINHAVITAMIISAVPQTAMPPAAFISCILRACNAVASLPSRLISIPQNRPLMQA